MRIALIFPPYTHKIFSENLGVVDEEFCFAPPIILAYVAAILERRGHQVILIDARALNLSKEQTLQQLRLFKPHLLSFRAETYHFHDALEWVGYLKRHLGVPVIAGGINLSLYPKETLFHPEIDYGIIGESIESLPRLISSLGYGDSIEDIPGVTYKEDGNIIINPPKEQYIDFDSYPFPARHLLPNDRYHSFISQLKNFTIMLASRGCPFRCTFCAIHPNTRYSARSPEAVADEIEICYKEFNIREIDFFDAVFFLGKARMLELFSQIRKRGLKLEWSCRSRVDVIDEEILRQAASAGCRQVYYGIESVDQGILQNVKKDIEPERVRQVIRWSKTYGIRPMGFFMVGNPGETKESVFRTIEFAKDLGLDFIQVCRTIAKPGTDLDRMMIETTGRDYWREHVHGKKIKGRLPTPWSILTELEIEALTKEFYLKFYFRPKIVTKRLLQLKSLRELKRYVRVGWKMLLQKSELYSHILTDTHEAERFLSESKKILPQARAAKVAVVIPTYNERDNIEGIISAVREVLPQACIVIVDDDSPDQTAVMAKQLSSQDSHIYVINRKGRRGLGLAYKDAFRFVLNNLDSDYIFEMDADFSHNPQYIPIFLDYAQRYELVTGSRFLNRVSIKNRVLWRNFISKSTKWFVNRLIGVDLTDITTGFKCFQRKVLEVIELDKVHSRGYAFQIEMSFLAKTEGFAVKELPILFIERSRGQSKMSLKIIIEGFCLVLKLAVRRLLRFSAIGGSVSDGKVRRWTKYI